MISVCDQTDPTVFKALPQGGDFPMIKQGGVLSGTTGEKVNPIQGYGRGQVSGWSGHFQKDLSMKQQWGLQQGFSAKPTQFGDCNAHIISGSQL